MALPISLPQAVGPQPIQIEISSPRVPCLTLIDLPGLTKVAVEGQPPSIVRDLEVLARKFASKETALILAVSPANADVATSDAMRCASLRCAKKGGKPP